MNAYSITEDLWMVPCSVDELGNFYSPLTQPLAHISELSELKLRQTWLPTEDKGLALIVKSLGTKGWSSIARGLNIQVHKGLPVRNGKQCRERYYNHIDPLLNKGDWKDGEDLFILETQREKGNKWSHIARSLDGRTENQVKNRFKSLMKRALKSHESVEEKVRYLITELKRERDDMYFGFDELENSLLDN